MGRALRAFGMADLGDFRVDTDAKGHVLGTVGLYSYTRDEYEAYWLSCFCVAPEARGRGIGTGLLDFAVAQARRRGRRLFYSKIYRELDLDAQGVEEGREALGRGNGVIDEAPVAE